MDGEDVLESELLTVLVVEDGDLGEGVAPL